MQEDAVCDIIVVSWNNLEFLKPCVESIIENTDVPYRLIAVDNGSQKDTIDYLEGLKKRAELKFELLRNSENLGWTKAINQGIEKSCAPYICFLNNDCVVMKDWLKELLKVAVLEPFIGCLNPTFNISGQDFKDFQLKLSHSHNHRIPYIELNECNGACMLVKRELIEKIGGLDESFGMGGMDDSDFSRRATKAGYRCVCAMASYVFHWENVSTNTIRGYWQKIRRKNEQLFIRRWGNKKQVAFIIDSGSCYSEQEILEQIKECLTLARRGVRFHIWVRLDKGTSLIDTFYRFSKGIPEHNNIKYSFKSMSRGIFILFCFAKLIARMLKKDRVNRLKTVFCASNLTYRYLKGLRWLHGAKILKGIREWKDFPLYS